MSIQPSGSDAAHDPDGARLAVRARDDELIAIEVRAARGLGGLSSPTVSSTRVPSAVARESGPGWDDSTADKRDERLAGVVGKRLVGLLRADRSDLDQLITTSFRATRPLPESLDAVFESATLRVARVHDASASPLVAATASDLRALRDRLVEGIDVQSLRSEFKVVDLSRPASDRLEASVLLRVFGASRDAGVRRERNARWVLAWSLENDELLHLLSLRIESHEEVTSRQAGGGPLFADVTASALAHTSDYAGLVLRGIEAQAQRVTRFGDLHLAGHHGLALGDVDGDGLEDVYVCDAGSLPNRLYLQKPDGTLREASKESGVDWLEDSRSALLIDLDNDGDQDLVVATIAVIAFAENNGRGVFRLRGGHRGAPYPYSMAAADFDVDGDLDVHVCVYSGAAGSAGERGFESRPPTPFDDARNGGRNVLLENLGSFRFADIAPRVGLSGDSDRWSLAASWEDVDRDGDPDLYVANDFGTNRLWRNDVLSGGERRFVDITASSGVEDRGAGMSVAWGDVNRDGRADLYVGNMFSSAGLRATSQAAIAEKPSGDAAGARRLRRMARGNSLFVSSPGGSFEDVSHAAGITAGRWAWSSALIDFDNDGWQDIVVANGFLTSESPVDL